MLLLPIQFCRTDLDIHKQMKRLKISRTGLFKLECACTLYGDLLRCRFSFSSGKGILSPQILNF